MYNVYTCRRERERLYRGVNGGREGEKGSRGWKEGEKERNGVCVCVRERE